MTATYPPSPATIRDAFYRHWMLACLSMAVAFGVAVVGHLAIIATLIPMVRRIAGPTS